MKTTGIRAQYHFRPSPNGFFAWDVRRLIKLAATVPRTDIPLTKIAEIDEMWWYNSSYDRPTPRSVADHARLIAAVDLKYPIILCAQGRLMDGMHRCLRALIDGHKTIPARQFDETPAPDYSDVRPGDLSYD